MIIAIIPAYNEEKTVEDIVRRTKKYVDKIIVVNDSSSDNTENLAKKAGAVVLTHKINQGLGTSIRDGLKKALSMKATIIITLDADGQHVPEEIPKFIKKIKQGYDFVLGTRDLRKYPFIKKFGNFFLNLITNFIAGTDLKDTESGFRVMTAEALKKMYFKSERYEIATEFVFEVGRNKLRATCVPIQSPIYVKGVRFIDGLRNFIFLMHRRERSIKDYLIDTKYVLHKYM